MPSLSQTNLHSCINGERKAIMRKTNVTVVVSSFRIIHFAHSVVLAVTLLAAFPALPLFAAELPAAVVESTTAAPQDPTEEAAAKLERERQREEVIEHAREEADDVDDELLSAVPSTVRSVLGYRILGVRFWRILVGAFIIIGSALLWIIIKRRFDARRKSRDTIVTVLGGWHLMAHVLLLALRNTVKVLLIGISLKLLATFIVTRFHPEIIWVSNIFIYFSLIVYLYDLVGLIDSYYGSRLFHSPDRLLDTVRPLVFKCIRGFILLIGALHIYQSVTGETLVSIIAGLGIGGLALALASQETLKNLLGFASIAMDQPFLVGDNIIIGEDEGVVETVGMRSLRIRKFDGSCAILPNSNAIATNILNKSRRPFIRGTFTLFLHPNNGIDKIEQAISLARQAMENHNGAVEGKPPVVRFEEWQPARLVINAYFWFDPNSQYDYSDEAARLNTEVYRRLSEAGIVFAER